MGELVHEVLAGEEAWFVGGAVRDELLGRPIVDVDVVCRDPAAAARAYAKRSGGFPFALSEQHSSWRVVLDGRRTVDFTPVHGSIESDLARRDFTVNAIAIPVDGGEHVDPSGGREDLQLRLRPADASGRAIHRFRRSTEPWAVDALAFLGAPELVPAVEHARAADFAEPLVRGDELGLPPGPEVGRLLDLIAEERAVGTISTRAEALELARREARK